MSDTSPNTANSQPAADEGVLLLLQVPRTNDKKELAAEQMFASLHGLLTQPRQGIFKDPEHDRLSLEITVRDRRIGFYIWTPSYLKDYVEEQIYAQYPTVQISTVEQAVEPAPSSETLVSELVFTSDQALPIKTFQSFEVDPLASITAALAKFEENESATIQLLIRPAKNDWHRRSERYAAQVRNGSSSGIGNVINMLWQSPAEASNGAKLTDEKQTRANAAEEKAQKLGYEVQLRILYTGAQTASRASLQMRSMVASFKQFNSTYLNGFTTKKSSADANLVADVRLRRFNRSRKLLCNIEEIATLYHLPHTNVETPFILWASTLMAEPPATLPVVGQRNDISPVAITNFRGHATAFGIPRADRQRHAYIIGQTGTGKSGMLELLTLTDIQEGQGFAVIDPHGDFALDVLKRIPASRVKDVVYFNPGDTAFPMGFNPLEVNDPTLRTHTCSELIAVLKRMFDYSWGPRLEYILRYCILALLDSPDSTMLDITRMLTDRGFRNDVLSRVTDPVVRNFWTLEYASWNEKFQTEAIAPVLNKVGAFTTNPLVRNIIGQPKSSFDLRQIMDEGKILIVNLSRGIVGEDNAALLGALLVTKIQMAAMSRANVPLAQRRPFYLYVDEFQNFATDSFATILSEARKYGLNLTVANQYIAQMLPEIRDAIFGNVGTVIAFRLSADDSRSVVRYFEPKFTETDLVQNNNRYFTLSMSIDGEKVPAFSAVTLDLPPFGEDMTAAIVAESHAHYSRPLADVEGYIYERYQAKQGAQPSQEPNGKKTAEKPAAREVVAPKDSSVAIADAQPTSTADKPSNPILAKATLASHAIKHSLTQAIEAPTKKKRRRRRKAKAPVATPPTTSQEVKTPSSPTASVDDGTTIYLR